VHKAGFVHGDLRSSNIFFVNGKLKVIDFDWAGNIDFATYPFDINKKIKWAKGKIGCKLNKIIRS
jgi:serine/threonine protein kinase